MRQTGNWAKHKNLLQQAFCSQFIPFASPLSRGSQLHKHSGAGAHLREALWPLAWTVFPTSGPQSSFLQWSFWRWVSNLGLKAFGYLPDLRQAWQIKRENWTQSSVLTWAALLSWSPPGIMQLNLSSPFPRSSAFILLMTTPWSSFTQVL